MDAWIHSAAYALLSLGNNIFSGRLGDAICLGSGPLPRQMASPDLPEKTSGYALVSMPGRYYIVILYNTTDITLI